MPDDDDSLKLCQIFYEDFGITRQIARLEHLQSGGAIPRAWACMCLDPANAMVHLLDNFVRAPQLAAMVFEDDPDHDVIQVTITDPKRRWFAFARVDPAR